MVPQMASDPPAPMKSPASAEVAEHLPPAEHGPSYTAWHPLLAQVLYRLLSSPALEVHTFVKLGTLPLEADIILLRKSAQSDLLSLFPEFDFLLQFLSHYLLIEYKSPLDRLTCDDFDTARAYAMLCKRKYGIPKDSQVAVALLYSQVEPAFFSTCSDNGYPFTVHEPGIWACGKHPLRIYAIDLVEYGSRFPEHPINLFSKRFRSYRPTDPRWESLIGYIQHLVRREMKTMQARLRGQEELNQSVDEITERLLELLPAETRLRGLPTEDRLRGLPPEERLRGLSAMERQRLRQLLDQEFAEPKP